MDGDWREERLKDKKEDLEGSDLTNREPKGIYEMKKRHHL